MVVQVIFRDCELDRWEWAVERARLALIAMEKGEVVRWMGRISLHWLTSLQNSSCIDVAKLMKMDADVKWGPSWHWCA